MTTKQLKDEGSPTFASVADASSDAALWIGQISKRCIAWHCLDTPDGPFAHKAARKSRRLDWLAFSERRPTALLSVEDGSSTQNSRHSGVLLGDRGSGRGIPRVEVSSFG